MTVTLLTHQMIAREAAAILEENMPFSTNVNRGREEEFTKAVQGYRKGDTVSVMVPGTGTVYNSSTFAGGGSAEVFTETSVSLTLDTQQHMAVTFTAKEKLLEIDDYKERILRPQLENLSAVVENDLITRAQKLTPWVVGTPGTTPTTAKTWTKAREKLQQMLAPVSNRTLLMSTGANVELVDASKALFNPAPNIGKMYTDGLVLGKFQLANVFETANLTAYGNGSDIVMTVNGASQTGSTLTVSGNTAVTKGQQFTMPGVFAVHPLTGNAYPDLQIFTITADSSTGSISISPPITPTFPNKTVSASPTDTNALTFIGSASTTYTRSLMFQRDAFTVAFAPLPVLASCEGYTYTNNGMSVRVMTFGNGTSDTESTRIDVLYGIAAVRPLHACQIIQ